MSMCAHELGWDEAQSMAQPVLVVGLGQTGLSCVRYLKAQGVEVLVADTRESPPGLEALRAEFPEVPICLGAFRQAFFRRAAGLVVSPGVSVREPAIEGALASGKPVLGDVELFARACPGPVLAITGSNGKSTVTSLLGEMAKRCGRRAAVGGNLGPPALSLLGQGPTELFVLELSSFQLETTHSLSPSASVVLNVTPDHMDRYPSLEAYARAKRRVYRGGGVMVINRDDPLVEAMSEPGRSTVGFGTTEPWGTDYGIRDVAGERWICRGGESLMPTAALSLPGDHNLSNGLAALALGSVAGFGMDEMCEALKGFSGLPHRCQLVARRRGVDWIDDSKATNVGAAVAAIRGIAGRGRIILIAGGDGKGADFGALREAVAAAVHAVVLLGRDAPLIEEVLRGAAPMHRAADMREAVRIADELAARGDTVLLSPACASLDQYRSYAERGEHFTALAGAGSS